MFSLAKEVLVPALAGFVLSMAGGKILIPILHKMKFGQYVRDDGPATHLKKEGTPTMGGVIFILSTVLVSCFYLKNERGIIPVLLSFLGFGLIGFLDDFLKIRKKQSEGLKPSQKMAGQLIVAVLLLVYLQAHAKVGTAIRIPFLSGTYELGAFYYILCFIMILGTVNGANFTDGLDGLGSSVTASIAVFFIVASYLVQAGISSVSAALFGSLLGFLFYNVYPAKVFMGDTGSLALGGFVASSALVLRDPLIVIIVAFIYLLEVTSVIIQVSVYKKTKKRVFRMAPIHHHFEKGGWPETEVTQKFTIVTLVLCLLGLLSVVK